MGFQVEVGRAVEADLGHLGLVHPVQLPVADLLVVRRPADDVERAAVEGQAIGVNRISCLFGRTQGLVGNEDGAVIVDALIELLHKSCLARVVAFPEPRAMKGLAEPVDVRQGGSGQG